MSADRHTGFAFDLLRVVSPEAEGNVVVSPWSVSSALGVLAPGCDEPARREIERALGSEHAGLAADAAGVVAEPSSDDEVLVVANTLWVDVGRTVTPAFLRELDQWPGATLRSVPIITDPDGARQTINANVAETTRDLIPEILEPGSITAEDRAVIVNALYLLVSWLEPFDDVQTVDEAFHAPGGTRDVPTMRGSREAPYAADGWEYLALPLRHGLQAEILLPSGDEEAPPLEELRARASPHRVDLHLPRFRVETGSMDLKPPLRALGVERIFDPTAAAVRAVIVEEPLFVSVAVHGAVLRVDETGIEGAAATALVLRTVAFRQLPEVEMRVDRPFLFLVTHRATRAVLFVARVDDP